MKNRTFIAILTYGIFSLLLAGNVFSEETPVVKKKSFSLFFLPAVAYRNEPATFVLKGTPGTSVSVSFEKKKMIWTFKGSVLESRISFPGKGILTLSCNTTRFSFRILTPEENVRVTIKNDWPHDENGLPVILLPDHCHPPKVNRTWQMARWLEGAVKDCRPRIKSLAFAGGRWIPASDRSRLKEISGSRPHKWHITPSVKSLFEIDGIIAQMEKITPAKMLMLSLCLNDLERGLNPLWLRMKLEWILQTAGKRGFEHIFVVGPPMTASEKKRYPKVSRSLDLACRSNRAIFVNNHIEKTSKRVDIKILLKRAMHIIQKTVCINEKKP